MRDAYFTSLTHYSDLTTKIIDPVCPLVDLTLVHATRTHVYTIRDLREAKGKRNKCEAKKKILLPLFYNLQAKHLFPPIAVLLVELIKVTHLEPQHPVKVRSLEEEKKKKYILEGKKINPTQSTTNLPAPILLPRWSELGKLLWWNIDR